MLTNKKFEEFLKEIADMHMLEVILLSLIPDEFEISQLAIICNKHNSTIRNHLSNYYIEGKDYYKKNPQAKNSKMLIAKATAIQIRRHYAN